MSHTIRGESFCRLVLWTVILLVMVCAAFASAASICVDVNGQQTWLETSAVPLSRSAQNTNAVFSVTSERTRFLSESGSPDIPYEVLPLLLPSDANLQTVQTRLEAAYIPVEGHWYVAPKPPIATRDREGNEIIIWPEGRTIIEGHDAAVYNTNAFWPLDEAPIVHRGTLGGWKLVEAAVPLFRYNPVTGELLELSTAYLTLSVEKTLSRASTAAARTIGAHATERVRSLAVNFDQFADTLLSSSQEVSPEFGQMAPASPSLSRAGYAIITTNAIRNASRRLADFVAHKQSTYTVSVITEDQYGSGSGDTAANNIRVWLQNNYTNSAYGNGGILYVLLIGDPRTNSSAVPMKMCLGDHPTDYFYAELTANWDANGNGIYGENGESDKYFEVYTGRIPYYGNINDTDNILQKIITYETSADTAWRRNALLPMVPLDDSTPAYQVGEQIKNNLLEPRAIFSTRIYEKDYGLIPPPEYLLKDRYPASEWSQTIYGLVVWMTHGSSEGGSGVISTGDVPNLNNTYPSAVYQGSCMTGEPETPTNLGYSILKNGGIGTIAASRNSWYWVGQSDFTNTSSIGGLGYQYARRLVERKTLGQAIWDTKETLDYWDKNYYVMNLYGDPSVVVMPPEPELLVTPTQPLYFNVTYGQTNPSALTLTLKSNAAFSMDCTLATEADWLAISPASGRLAAGSTATVTIQLTETATLLGVGTHSATVAIYNTTLDTVEERTVVLKVYPASLRGYWPLDETAGTTAYDATGEGKDGLLKGDFSFETNSIGGPFANALEFDGIDDAIEIPALNLYSNRATLSAWIRRDSSSTDWAGVVFCRAGNTVAGINIRRNGELRYHWNEQSNTYNWASGLMVPVGKKIFVALVIEPDKATLYMYDNGTLYSSSQNVVHDIEEFNGPLWIGRDPTQNRYFKGAIDDVRIYSTALNTQQINAVILGGPSAVPTPSNGRIGTVLVPDLTWVMGASAVFNDVYFGTDYYRVLNADTASGEYQGRQEQTIFRPGTLKRYTEYFWRVDQVTANGTVIAGTTWRFETGNGCGAITRQVWHNISGNYVTNLTGHSNYPDKPNLTDTISSFDCPRDWADNYGTRVHGFLVPPISGHYTFWIASDDYSELWLSPTTNPADRIKIAEVPGYTSYQQWNKYPSSQQSSSYSLAGGRPYYIMALHKEGGGGDHLSVAWSGPNFSRCIIAGENLMPYAPDYSWGPVFNSSLLFAENALEGYSYQASVAGTAVALDGEAVTYSKLAGPMWLKVEPDGLLHGVPGDGDTGRQSFGIRATDAQGAASDILLELNVQNTYTGQAGLADLAALAGFWLTEGCLDVPPCGGADLTGDGQVDNADLNIFSKMWLIDDPSQGLLSSWPFDTDASDSTADHHGLLINGAHITEEDVIGTLGKGALSLDGLGGHVQIPNFKGIGGKAPRTVSAWIKSPGAGHNMVITYWGRNAVGQQYLFGVLADGSVVIYSYGPHIKTIRKVLDNRWHHVAAVLPESDSPALSDVRLYIDGVLQTQTYLSADAAINTALAYDLMIGAMRVNSNQTDSFYKGLIDDVRLYDRALTDLEIESLALRDLQLHLSFDESTGSQAADGSPYFRDATVLNNPQWMAESGTENGALSLNGTTQYVRVTNYTGLVGTSPRTVMAWIKSPGNTTNGTIVSWGVSQPGQQFLLGGFTDGSLGVFSGGSYIRTQGNVLWDNQWHHVAAVLPGGMMSSLADVRLYIDGIERTDVYLNANVTLDTVPSGDVLIGAFENAPNQIISFFKGLMDEVRIYDKALDADQIAEIIR